MRTFLVPFIYLIATLLWCGCMHAAAAPDTPDLSIRRAIELRWPGADGHQYQVYSSADEANWTPIGEPIVGHAATNSFVYLPDASAPHFLSVRELPGAVTNRLIGLTDIAWDPAGIARDGQGLTLLNLRVQSADFSVSNSVLARFGFDSASQALQLSEYRPIPAPGLYYEPYFACDNTNTILLCQSNSTCLTPGVTNWITTEGTPFYINAAFAHALSLNIFSVTNDFWFRVVDPAGQLLENRRWPARVPASTPIYPVITPGRYYFQFIPLTGQPFHFQLSFWNANDSALNELTNGATISLTFAPGSREYAKYYVDLSTNQLLSLPSPGILLQALVLNERCEVETMVMGLPLNFQPTVSGRYFLFFDCFETSGGTYTATVSVSPAPAGAAVGLAANRSLNIGALRNPATLHQSIAPPKSPTRDHGPIAPAIPHD